MKINTTNGILLVYDQQLEKLNKNVLGLLLRGKIQSFYQDNGIRISTIKEKRNALIEKYLVVENGKTKIQKVDGKSVVVMQDESLRGEFEIAMKNLLESENVMEV